MFHRLRHPDYLNVISPTSGMNLENRAASRCHSRRYILVVLILRLGLFPFVWRMSLPCLFC